MVKKSVKKAKYFVLRLDLQPDQTPQDDDFLIASRNALAGFAHKIKFMNKTRMGANKPINQEMEDLANEIIDTYGFNGEKGIEDLYFKDLAL